MSKKVISGRLFDVLNIPGLPQFGPALPSDNAKSKGIKMSLEDSGMLSLTWVEAGKQRRALIGVSMIKHLELEPETVG